MKTVLETPKTKTLDQFSIYLQKSSKVIIDTCKTVPDYNLVGSLVRNLEPLGYTVSHQLFNALCCSTKENLVSFYHKLVPVLKAQTGAHRQFRPMYPNFPQQVMDTPEFELYLNALIHYWSAGKLVPNTEKEENVPLLDNLVKLKTIDLGSQTDFDSIFTRLLSANSSVSESDKDILRWFIKTYDSKTLESLLPESIPQKEQRALLIGEFIQNGKDISKLIPLVKTATDVLRVAVVMSGGDVSLAANTKFRNFKRPERRQILQTLENLGEITEDMLRYKGQWIKLGERLHPGEFKKQFPRSFSSFDVLRNDRPFETFNGKIEKGIKEGRFADTVLNLTDRPGDFARRLDHLIRKAECKNAIVRDFLSVADKVSTPVLLQCFNHFKNRGTSSVRPIFPKGNTAKLQILKNDLPEISESLTKGLSAGIQMVLTNRFSQLENLGKVFVDPALADFVVPFSQRSASKALRTIARGSKFSLPAGDILRFFLWWKNGDGRTDIDLSCTVFDENWTKSETIAFYNLKNSILKACHSGDIVDAPEGACEFIDFDLRSVKNASFRYVVFQIYSYTQQPYCDLPECFGGLMVRSGLKSGEIFEPRTVTDKIDLSSDSKIAIPMVVDVVDMKAIWVDLSLTNRSFFNTSYGNHENMKNMGEVMTKLNRIKPNLYDLLQMHARGRGMLVNTPEAADTVFTREFAWETDEILSKYLQ